MQTPKVDAPTRYADRYALLEQLHVGSATEVWLARDERADIAVALKLLSAQAAEKSLQRSVFEREYRIARSLNHQHTVRALSWHDGEHPGYAMQYVDGTDFSDLVGLPADVWMPALLVVIDTLDYWHRKGVVHGDVKPSNCLIDRRGVSYLADFSTAAIVDDDETIEARGGTTAYASPEQIAGQPPHTADDVYALGRVISELAGGAPDAALPDDLPPGIAAAVRRTQSARDDRPSAAALRDAFAQAGVARGTVALREHGITLRRAAASVAGNVSAPSEAMPHGAFERVPASTPEEREGISLQWVLVGLALIVLLGVAVTYGVSALRSDGDTEQTAATTETIQPPAASETVSPEPAPAVALPQSTGNRASADALVAEVIDLLSRLEARGVERWGGASLESGRARYAEGDRAYLAADFDAAVQRYTDAKGILEPLAQGIDQRFSDALRAADAAMLARDANGARAAFELALAITPGNGVATRGIERANNLDAVLGKMAEGRVAERAGKLVIALAHYRDALDLDDLWQPAIEARDRINARIAADAFAADMSRGLSAMEAGDFSTARTAFNAAARLRPDAPGPKDALLDLRLSERLERITGLRVQAESAESAEQWGVAKQRYEDMLEIDASLDVAKAGVIRADERIVLSEKLSATLRYPDALSQTSALREASALLTIASAAQPRGPALAKQIDALTTLLTTVALPLPVELRSDGLTSVTLLKVERLGEFDVTQVRLRPGLYTLVGTRRGYVDTRRQFRVVAGEAIQPVYIACEQPI
ncbi:MAG: protein kinase [Pseudomonadota bacterium]